MRYECVFTALVCLIYAPCFGQEAVSTAEDWPESTSVEETTAGIVSFTTSAAPLLNTSRSSASFAWLLTVS